MRSGEVADAAGVNLQTLRYYERRGLIREPRRSLGGHRLYPAETVTAIRVIKAAQRLGFTLVEVAELMTAARHHHHAPVDASLRKLLRRKLDDVEQKLADLDVIRARLVDAIEAGCTDMVTCSGRPDCPLPFAELGTSADR